MKTLLSYINESKIDINEIKNFLIKDYHVKTWEECIDSQKYGDCKLICKKIIKQFPNTFDYMLDIHCDFSNDAQKLINDDEEMFGNHYILVKNNKYYDFARGANCINDVYVLTQNNNKDKYNVIMTDEEKKLISAYIKTKIKS